MRKLSFEDVKKLVESRNCELLSTEYFDMDKKLEIKFSCGWVNTTGT